MNIDSVSINKYGTRCIGKPLSDYADSKEENIPEAHSFGFVLRPLSHEMAINN